MNFYPFFFLFNVRITLTIIVCTDIEVKIMKKPLSNSFESKQNDKAKDSNKICFEREARDNRAI